MQNIYQKIVTSYSVYVASFWDHPKLKADMAENGSVPLAFNNNGEVATFAEILPHCELIVKDSMDDNRYVWSPGYSRSWCGGFNTVTIKVPKKPKLEHRALAISVYSTLFPTFAGLVAEDQPFTDVDDMGWLSLGEYTGSIITMAWAAQDLPVAESDEPSESEQLLRYFKRVYDSKEMGSGKLLVEKFLQKNLPWDVELIFEEDPDFEFIYNKDNPLLSKFKHIPKNSFTFHPPSTPSENEQGVAISEYCKFTNATAL